MHVIITSLCPAKVMWRHGFHLTERGDRQRVRDGLRGTLGAPPGHCFCPHHLHPLPNTKGQQTQRLWAKSVLKHQRSKHNTTLNYYCIHFITELCYAIKIKKLITMGGLSKRSDKIYCNTATGIDI